MHKVIRYQPFTRRLGYDMGCECGMRWILNPLRRTYVPMMQAVADHFGWPDVPENPTAEEMEKWLVEHLPENIRPQKT